MRTPDGHRRDIHIGSVEGAFAIGDRNHVTYNQGVGSMNDPAQAELLGLVRRLRDDLARTVTTPQTALLNAELADAEVEMVATGEAAPGRLTRLRQALADASAVTGVLASGAAVAESVRALLGG
ncbi:hypothetical protein AB0N81_31425 [Streptomyces sp. NPDC093510]|uniref:hypothetical protein n=1 Tax=Streptomyces sp. NPDC093510 TaxID=3155199 RepID=UPI0034365A80